MTIILVVAAGFFLTLILYRMEKIMETVQDVAQDLTDITGLVAKVSADTDNLLVQIANLSAQIGNGSVVTQADIDALHTSAQAIKDSLTAEDAKVPDAAA